MAYNKFSPDYYTRGTIEVWDFIRDQGLSYHLGNAIKYICRAGHKDDYKKDLVKAIHYLENELQHESRGGVSTQVPHSKLPPYAIYTEDFDR